MGLVVSREQKGTTSTRCLAFTGGHQAKLLRDAVEGSNKSLFQELVCKSLDPPVGKCFCHLSSKLTLIKFFVEEWENMWSKMIPVVSCKYLNVYLTHCHQRNTSSYVTVNKYNFWLSSFLLRCIFDQ